VGYGWLDHVEPKGWLIGFCHFPSRSGKFLIIFVNLSFSSYVVMSEKIALNKEENVLYCRYTHTYGGVFS
jgi:hypothetical protein